MKKLILTYVGTSDWGNKLYQDQEGIYFIKDDNEEIIYVGRDQYNDPYGNIDNIDRYRDLEVIIKDDKGLLPETKKYDYMMLSRLKMDCDYYLGNGGRHSKDLWAGNKEEHIKEMKRIYNSFEEHEKPQWINCDDILNYEQAMIK